MDNQSSSCYGLANHRFLAGLIGLFLLILTVFFVIAAVNKAKEGKYIGQDVQTKNTILVDGLGEVYAKPDLAVVDFSVVNEEKTVSEALKKNTEKMNAVIEAMKSEGIEDKDLKTTNFNISPRYEYRNELYILPENRRVLMGYEVSQSLEVKIRKMDQIGKIIERATSVGANQVGDLQFTFDDPEKLKQEARAKAIKTAKEKAKLISGELNVNLVRVISFYENFVTPWRDYGVKAYGIGGGGEASVPQIQTGENKISVTVDITYEIN